jgi:hypothetical protein
MLWCKGRDLSVPPALLPDAVLEVPAGPAWATASIVHVWCAWLRIFSSIAQAICSRLLPLAGVRPARHRQSMHLLPPTQSCQVEQLCSWMPSPEPRVHACMPLARAGHQDLLAVSRPAGAVQVLDALDGRVTASLQGSHHPASAHAATPVHIQSLAFHQNADRCVRTCIHCSWR